MGRDRRTVFNAGSIGGYVVFGFLADEWGRKRIAMLYFLGAFAMVPVLFAGTNNVGIALLAAVALGWFASGQYTWMAAWLPELFPTRMRATAAAFVFNAPRLIAWVGPLISGALIANLGGYSQAAITISIVYLLGLAAAPFLPETNGKPLPP